MVSSSSSFRQRAVFAGGHITSAALFTRLCSNVEKKYQGQPNIPVELYDEQRTYVTAAIFASVAFLEAAINELFTDSVELNPNELGGTLIGLLAPNIRELMADMWKLEIPRTARYSILEKYNIALTLARKNLFQSQDQLYQEINLVIVLRNALTHSEPVWTMEAASDHITYYKIYEGSKSTRISRLEQKFSNPLALRNRPFFPDRCLCHACAVWAVTSCLNFAKAFFERMGILNYPTQSVMSLPLI